MSRTAARIALLLMMLIGVASCSSTLSTSASTSTPAGTNKPGSTTSTAPASVFPSVMGGFGSTPSITFPDAPAPRVLETHTLVLGSGPSVGKGDLLVANYVGQIWRAKVFDSSFSRHQLAAFPLSHGRVIPGWYKTLVGVRAGSRVLLVIPPIDGYGAAGDSAAGITGTDTLVFVVDVVASYSHSVTGDLRADLVSSGVNGISVTGPLGQPPTVRIGGIPPPTSPMVTILAKGHGPNVAPGLVVVQYVAADWTTSSIVKSTWQDGFPDGEVVGQPPTPSALDLLVGIPVGSRVLLQVPKNPQGDPYAFVIDIAAEPT